MKKHMKKLLFFTALAAIAIIVIPGQVDGEDGDSCLCYSVAEAKNACAFQNEYVSSTALSGKCYGPSCKAKVRVKCKDLDEGGEPYEKIVYIWGDNCPACTGSGGSGGSGDAGFEDLPGDYGNWHDPNWN